MASRFRLLRLRLLSLLDQKAGREKSILRKSILALERRMRRGEPENRLPKGYHQKSQERKS